MSRPLEGPLSRRKSKTDSKSPNDGAKTPPARSTENPVTPELPLAPSDSEPTRLSVAAVEPEPVVATPRPASPPEPPVPVVVLSAVPPPLFAQPSPPPMPAAPPPMPASPPPMPATPPPMPPPLASNPTRQAPRAVVLPVGTAPSPETRRISAAILPDKVSWAPLAPLSLEQRFRLETPFELGALGMTYAGVELETLRPVHVLLFHPALFAEPRRKSQRQRLERALRYKHPGLAPVYATGEAFGSVWAATAPVGGLPLTHWRREVGSMQLADVYRIMGQLLDAVAVVHKEGGVHGGLSPETIRIVQDQAWVTHPFWLEPVEVPAGELRPQRTSWLAPELVFGEAADRPETDIYGLGLALGYLLACGLTEPGHSLLVQGIDVPPAVDEVYVRATARQRDQRYPIVAAFRAALEAAAGFEWRDAQKPLVRPAMPTSEPLSRRASLVEPSAKPPESSLLPDVEHILSNLSIRPVTGPLARPTSVELEALPLVDAVPVNPRETFRETSKDTSAPGLSASDSGPITGRRGKRVATQTLPRDQRPVPAIPPALPPAATASRSRPVEVFAAFPPPLDAVPGVPPPPGLRTGNPPPFEVTAVPVFDDALPPPLVTAREDSGLVRSRSLETLEFTPSEEAMRSRPPLPPDSEPRVGEETVTEVIPQALLEDEVPIPSPARTEYEPAFRLSASSENLLVSPPKSAPNEALTSIFDAFDPLSAPTLAGPPTRPEERPAAMPAPVVLEKRSDVAPAPVAPAPRTTREPSGAIVPVVLAEPRTEHLPSGIIAPVSAAATRAPAPDSPLTRSGATRGGAAIPISVSDRPPTAAAGSNRLLWLGGLALVVGALIAFFFLRGDSAPVQRYEVGRSRTGEQVAVRVEPTAPKVPVDVVTSDVPSGDTGPEEARAAQNDVDVIGAETAISDTAVTSSALPDTAAETLSDTKTAETLADTKTAETLGDAASDTVNTRVDATDTTPDSEVSDSVSPPVATGPIITDPNTVKCPAGMIKLRKKIQVDGADGAKVDAWEVACIDAFEYPGAGATPSTGLDQNSARAACVARGKRLCTRSEWRRACGGTYPYGKEFDAEKCNTAGADGTPKGIAAAGSKRGCMSPSGAFDMVGNVAEWTSDGFVNGGSSKNADDATCGTGSRRVGGASHVGFRCCADAK